MKISPIVNRIAWAMLLTAVVWLGLTVVTFKATSQTPCCDPPLANPAAAKWNQYAQVAVTIDTQFTQTERDKIVESFQDWNVAAPINCSHVTFSGFLPSSTPPQPGSNNVHWVTYRDVFSYRGIAVTAIWIKNIGGIGTIQASTAVYKNIRMGYPPSFPPFMLATMRHEIGHTFFLRDATECLDPASTVMSITGTIENVITSCDSAVVASVYCAAPSCALDCLGEEQPTGEVCIQGANECMYPLNPGCADDLFRV